MKANEAKLEAEKRRLKDVLDASEGRGTKLELSRRSLEGELQRARLVLGDREAEVQVLHDRIDLLQRQVRLLCCAPGGRDGTGRGLLLPAWGPSRACLQGGPGSAQHHLSLPALIGRWLCLR